MTEAKRDASKARFKCEGVNHVALVCRDMAETVDFYENVLDMPLVKTIGFPGGAGQHFFFDCGGGATLAFMWFPNAPPVAPGIASQNLDVMKDGAQSAHASMNHLAITVPLEKFDEYVDLLRSRGVKVHVINHNDGGGRGDTRTPTEHTWIRSMYFWDPNGIRLEFAALTRAYNRKDIGLQPVNAEGKIVPPRKKAMQGAED